MITPLAAAASFRDASGFVFFSEGQPFRQVNSSYRDDFEALKKSGLLDELHEAGLLIRHHEIPFSQVEFPGAIAVLRPEKVPLVSYPYEWSFSQLKDAALCTLDIQKRALKRGMALRDASAYNVQFVQGRPMLIDTLSFERYVEGRPWAAYKQFCQHFLAPLALMSQVDPGCGQLSRLHIDGVPLDLASKLLPWKTRLSFGLVLHIHLHAKAQRKLAPDAKAVQRKVGKVGLLGLLDNLCATISGQCWKASGTTWADYYDHTNYSKKGMAAKRNAVRAILLKKLPEVVWDLGANTGEFSDIAAEISKFVVAWDIDPAAVERNYTHLKFVNQDNVLPLQVDLSNPSPGLGWAHRERDSFIQRANADIVMALALIHHLAIGNNVPLGELARFLSYLGPTLIIEFVPKSDSQVQRMLSTRKDVFPEYTREGFEKAFSERFQIVDQWPIPDSDRIIYLMERDRQS